VFQTLQVFWLGAALFTLHIVRNAAERLLPDSTLTKLHDLAEPVVLLLPSPIRHRLGVAGPSWGGDAAETPKCLDKVDMTERGGDKVNDIKSEEGEEAENTSQAVPQRKGSQVEEPVVQHKLSVIQQLNKTVQQVDDAQKLVGTAASYSEKLLNALAFEDRYVSLVLYALLFVMAIVSSAAIVVGQLVWVLVAPMLMWPSTGEVLVVVLNVGLLPLEKLLWVVPTSWQDKVVAALSELDLGANSGGLPDLKTLGKLVPAPIGNVLGRSPDELEVAHRAIARTMVKRGEAVTTD
jgi:hypothetical protein